MTTHYADDRVTLHHGDALDILRTIPDASIDAVVTDPPYGLEFMGKGWDAPWKDTSWKTTTTAPDATATPSGLASSAGRAGTSGAQAGSDPARAASATIVQPDAVGGFQDGAGGNAYSRSRVRTDTRRHGGDMQVANASFQAWCELWAVECLRVLKPGGHILAFGGSRTWHRLASAVEDAGFEIRDSIAWLYGSGFAKSWNFATQYKGEWCSCDGGNALPSDHAACSSCGGLDKAYRGHGSALKPAFEPIVVGRKPLVGTVAGNVLTHGTGALNIDGCRVVTDDSLARRYGGENEVYGQFSMPRGTVTGQGVTGRWPANVVLDESQAAALDQQTGTLKSGFMAAETDRTVRQGDAYGQFAARTATATYGDSGGASRFFPTFRYQAKAPTRERVKLDGVAHPTVKPLDLMRWLVRLVTPPGGVVLEPFAGSGTTVEACVLEGFRCVAIEREADYLPLIVARLARATPAPVLPDELDEVLF